MGGVDSGGNQGGHGDTVAWAATAVTMGLLLSIGAILTRPDNRRPVRPGIPTNPTRRPFR